MKREEFLNLPHWPALLSIEETAWALGVEQFCIAGLTSGGLLEPVGRPLHRGRKFYCRERILELSKDSSWVNRAAICISNYNALRNAWSVEKAGTEQQSVDIAPGAENATSSICQ